jgi:hypothetical protein
MGLWDWIALQRRRCTPNRFLHRRDVSLYFTTHLVKCYVMTRMYDRHLDPDQQRILPGIRYRLETLVGITGYKMAKYRSRWSEIVWACLNVVWRPQFLLVAFFEVSSHIQHLAVPQPYWLYSRSFFSDSQLVST